MPLDEQTQALLVQLAQIFPSEPDLQQLRRAGLDQLPPLELERVRVASVQNMDIPGPDGRLPIRIYHPHAASSLGNPPPLLIYFHGGGHVLGSLDGWDGLCCNLCEQSGCIIVSVDYRLAPEHKFPAAVEDAYAAVAWAAAHGTELGGDPAKIAVAGDSAGGNLAAVACLVARDRNGPAIGFQVLLYPPTNARADTDSRRRNSHGYLLTAEMMDWFTEQYLPHPDEKLNPYYSPCKAENLAGLPPALVVTAEFDPLRDEGEAYANRLARSGVKVEHVCFEGTIHGFVNFYKSIDKGRDAIAMVSDRLRRAFS